MPKEIKKLYKFLGLNIDAQYEQIVNNQKSLIKTIRAKAIKNGIDCKNQVDQIVLATNKVLNYVQTNGYPKIKKPLFKTTLSDVLSGLFACFLLLAICIACIISI